MKLTGILKKPIIDYDTLRPMLVFASNEDFSQAYEELKGYDKLSLYRTTSSGSAPKRENQCASESKRKT